MKKTVLAILLCAVALAAQAQWNGASSQAHLKNLGQKQQDQANKFSETVDNKVALSSMRIGKYTFELRGETEAKEDGIKRQVAVHKYFYRPKNGPAVFRESVKKDIATGEFSLISDPSSLLVGPLYWKYVDYTISQINVIVYQGNYLSSLRWRWSKQFGLNCTHQYRMGLTWPMDMLDVWVFPKRAFYMDNTTVAIEAVISADKMEGYPRVCKARAPGVLFRKFMSGTEKFIVKWKKHH